MNSENLDTNANSARRKVAVVGSGLIGRCWAAIFAKSGYEVSLYDIDNSQILNALESCKTQLITMEKDGFLNDAEKASTLITGTSDLKEALSGAFYVQRSSIFELM
eukprot:gene420-1056_t